MVSTIKKFKKRFCKVYDADNLVYEVSELAIYCEC